MKAIRAVCLTVGLALACSDEPSAPRGVGTPDFALVTSTDPTRILTVGVDAPANLVLKGTVAGIVVSVDNAVLDLSKATVDCSAQTTSPTIGVWIQPHRAHVSVKGGGTGVVTHCATGVLIGPADPGGGEPGGSANRVSGLLIQESAQPMLLSNSHDNTIDGNRIPLSQNGITVVGNDPSAAASGKNLISGNTIATGWYSIVVSSDANTVKGNVLAGMAEAGIAVDHDANLITGNQTIPLPGEDPSAIGIQLFGGADDNTVTANQVAAWAIGVDVEANAFRNLIRGNTAVTVAPSGGFDAVDRSGNCVNNTWARNAFRNSDPPCIVGVTVDAVTFTSPATLQLEGAAAAFNATFTNHSTVRLTDVAMRTWVEQGPAAAGLGARRLSRWSLVSCAGMPGVLPAGSCTQAGEVSASNSAVGGGTLAVGSARARIELAHVVAGDTVILDSRAVAITLTPPATGSFWELRAPMPTARQHLAAATGDGTAYAVGGFGGTLDAVVALEAYHPVDDSWTTRAPMPTARYDHGAGVVNGTLYVAGGINPLTGQITGAVEAYDPAANTWSSVAPLPTPRLGLAIAVVNGVFYAVGGATNDDYTGVVEAYNPSTNSWTTMAPMPTPRYELAVGVVNGIIYAVGGFNRSGASGAVEAYDPVSNTWSSVASLPRPRFGLAVGSAKGVLVAIGGSEMSGLSGAVEIYDPTSNSWTDGLPMPTPRENLAAGVINGVVYTFGGLGCVPGTCAHLATGEAFHP